MNSFSEYSELQLAPAYIYNGKIYVNRANKGTCQTPTLEKVIKCKSVTILWHDITNMCAMDLFFF